MQNRIWNKQNTVITNTYSKDMFSFACEIIAPVYPTTGLLDAKSEHRYIRRSRN